MVEMWNGFNACQCQMRQKFYMIKNIFLEKFQRHLANSPLLCCVCARVRVYVWNCFGCIVRWLWSLCSDIILRVHRHVCLQAVYAVLLRTGQNSAVSLSLSWLQCRMAQAGVTVPSRRTTLVDFHLTCRIINKRKDTITKMNWSFFQAPFQPCF